MTWVMVRYRVKADRVGENEELVRAVYKQVQEQRPDGLRYATFKLEDGVSFVHLASVEAADGRNPLLELAAFREFQKEIADRSDERPVVTGIDTIGSFRLFEGDE